MNDVTKESKAKGPRTAYALFQKEQGSQILAKHKAGSIGERSKILAAEWKKVSEEEKARCAYLHGLCTLQSEPAHNRQLHHSAWHSTCSS